MQYTQVLEIKVSSVKRVASQYESNGVATAQKGLGNDEQFREQQIHFVQEWTRKKEHEHYKSSEVRFHD